MKLPWTLYRHVGRETYLYFAICLGALSLLFMVASGLQAVNNSFSLRIVMPWIFESLGYALFFTVPVALLFANTLVLGRIVADKEYTAICASGVSPLHIFVPSGALALLLTIVAFSLQGTVLPHAHYVKRNISQYLVKQLENMGTGYEKSLPLENGNVYCDEFNGAYLKGVHITKTFSRRSLSGDEIVDSAPDADDDKIPVTVYAKEALVSVDSTDGQEAVLLSLKDVVLKAPHMDSETLWASEGIKWPSGWERLDWSGINIRFPINEKGKRYDDKTTSALYDEIDQNKAAIRQLEAGLAAADEVKRAADEKTILTRESYGRKMSAEIWRRRALALSCFSFAFIGFPISLTLRHRHRLAGFFIGSMFVVLVYYPLLMMGENIVRIGLAPAPIALLSGNLVLMGVATYLTGRLYLR